MQLPEHAARLMSRQHGLITRQQLLAFMKPNTVESLVRRQHLLVVERGVYRPRYCAVTPEQRPLAAALRSAPDAKVTGPFSLWLHGLGDLAHTAPWEVLRRPGRRLRGAGFDHRVDPTPEEEIVVVRSMPTVPVASALVDSARSVDRIGVRALRLAYDQARWKGLTTPDAVRARAERLGRRDVGARVFLEWDDRGELVPESDGERRLGRVVSCIAPLPEPQVAIAGYRIDWYWALYRFGLEYQGGTDHRSARNRLADTRRAQSLLRRRDVLIHPVVSRDLRDDEVFVTGILQLLQVRARELGVKPPQIVRKGVTFRA